MKVLLTGHRGYIGCVLTPMLLERGHRVTGLDSDLFRACTFVGKLTDVPNIEKDIRDIVPEDLVGFDAIIHLAGLSNDPLGDYRAELTDEINFQASKHLARTAKRVGIQRFLYASSCSSYGSAGESFVDESATFEPVTPYGISKVNAERAIAPMADETFSPTFLRASTAFGLSPRLRFDLVVNNLTAWAFTTGQVYLKSNGLPWRPLVHVEDIALAYIAALEADRDYVHNQAFNVGVTTENYQIREVAEMVKAVVPNSRVEFAPDAGPDARCYRVDCNYIARRLHGFKPQWTVRRGIEQLYESFTARGLTLDEFEGERFKRIAHVTKLVREGEIDDDFRRVPSKQPLMQLAN